MPSLAQNVTVIPAKKAIGTQKITREVQRVRVAAYCRVSTEYEEQESSYEMQVEHYTAFIKANPAWEFAGIYADDGISGTNTKKRDEFNRMIEDCKAGKIDRILTKSISRFSRNTVDCLKYTRELKAMNIAVFFEKENIDTLDAKGEVLMTIMAALAQQESESLSANVRLGIQYRNQQGKVRVNHNRFLGYTKDEEGKLVIVPEEAAIVRRIYAEYLDGKSCLAISRGLEADGLRNGAGSLHWCPSNIHQILTNEKYIGDALLQKTYTVSILEKKRQKNRGALPKYYVEGCHEAIISKEIFLKVREEIVRRGNMCPAGKRRCYSGKYALSGVLVCGHCGDIYRRVSWNQRGKRSAVWRCVSRIEVDGPDCPARTVREDAVHAATVEVVNRVFANKDSAVKTLRENITEVLDTGDETSVEAIDALLRAKQIELLDAGRDEAKIEEISGKIKALRERRMQLVTDPTLRTDRSKKVEDMIDFINAQGGSVTEYSDILVRRLIERITVYDDKLTFEFKSGLEIDIQA